MPDDSTYASLFLKKKRVAQPSLFTEPTPAPEEKQQQKIWTVRALVSNLCQTVERSHPNVWVEGEISNCRPASSGHIYFTLKDGDAQLPIVLFRTQAMRLRFRPTDGLSVLVRGRISIYESRGQLQLIADTLEPRGEGALRIAFDQLKARLAAEGLFTPSRKRPLPPFPQTLGLITSRTGAVLHDVTTILRRRHQNLNVIVYPASMQGANSPAQVIAAIRFFNQALESATEAGAPRLASQMWVRFFGQQPPPDLILIARGGGSFEDLACFNDEALARAIAASVLPIVSAIGHETDFTIADFVADHRAPTPSAAAEIITAHQHQIASRITQLAARLTRAARYQLLQAHQRFNRVSSEAAFLRLQQIFNKRQQHLDDLTSRLTYATTNAHRQLSLHLADLESRLQQQSPTARLHNNQRRYDRASHALLLAPQNFLRESRRRLQTAEARLHTLSPLAVLQRGYAIVTLPNGQIITNASQTPIGAETQTHLAHGTLTSTITNKTNS